MYSGDHMMCTPVQRIHMLDVTLSASYVIRRQELLNPVQMYKVVQIWPGQTVSCLHTNSPGHIWTTLYHLRRRQQSLCGVKIVTTERNRKQNNTEKKSKNQKLNACDCSCIFPHDHINRPHWLVKSLHYSDLKNTETIVYAFVMAIYR